MSTIYVTIIPSQFMDPLRILAAVASPRIILGWLLITVCAGASLGAGQDGLGARLSEIESRVASEQHPPEKVEAWCLQLLTDSASPLDRGRVYSFIASVYAKDMSRYHAKVIEYCRKALGTELDAVGACEIHLLWGQALELEHRGPDGQYSRDARSEIGAQYLEGIKVILKQSTPERMQGPPAVGRFHFDGPANDQRQQELSRKHDEQVKARNRVLAQNKLVQLRDVLTVNCSRIYEAGRYEKELVQLASQILGDDTAVQRLCAEIRKASAVPNR
jgi:hypothetical protein